MRSRILNDLLASVVVGTLGSASVGLAIAQNVGAPSQAASDPGAPAGSTTPETGATGIAPAATQSPPASPAATSPVAPAVTANETPAVQTEASSALTPPAPYLTGDARLPAAELEAWIAAPRSIIELPVVPERVSARAERLLGSDARAVPTMVSLATAQETTPEERAMIVIGFARATRSAEGVAPEYAAYLQEAIARSGSESLIAAYNVAFQTTEIETSAIGGAGGGAGGGGGAGSLSGGGDSGTAGSIGGDAVVPTTSPLSGSRGGGSVAFTDSSDGTDGQLSITIRCEDASTTATGCTF